MSPAPQIITYRSEDAPERERWLACFRSASGPLPIVFRGRTKDLVVAAAAEWWTGEIAKEYARVAQAARMAERRRGA